MITLDASSDLFVEIALRYNYVSACRSLKELSDACNLEYSAVRFAFRDVMSFNILVASIDPMRTRFIPAIGLPI